MKRRVLHSLKVSIEKKRKKYNYLPSVSYGSAMLLTGDIVSVKDLADQNMYLNKEEK